MCVEPRLLEIEGREVRVPCYRCRECRSDRIRDRVGRCLGEAKYSAGAYAITLTYGDSLTVNGESHNIRALFLHYSDIRLWLARIRKKHKVRFLIAGEYGSLKGRAHWHALLFFWDTVPEVPEHVGGRCWHDPYWPHGHTKWDDVDQATIRYVCKYILKDDGDEYSESLVRQSTKPLLGAAYFDEWARRHVDQQLPLHNRMYSVDGSVDPRTGKLWQYFMTDAAADYCCASFARQWRERYGTEPPSSPVFDKFEDAAARLDNFALQGKREFKRAPSLPSPLKVEWERMIGAGEVGANEAAILQKKAGYSFDDRLNVFFCIDPHNMVRMFWSYDEEGFPAWSPELVVPSEAARRRAELRSKVHPAIRDEMPKGQARPRVLYDDDGYLQWLRLGRK